ncbi:MAG: M28 family peptidase [Candidatus Methanomethylicia archaeon]|nr:M28 family peptidase [Candidatus Methanomethylicia archaeon]
MVIILNHDIEINLIENASVNIALQHMKFLVNEVGERIAGTKEIEKAANYIVNELLKYGLKAYIEKFPIYHSYPKEALLKVLEPEQMLIEAKPCGHISSTLLEGITGELVYVGPGGYDDYKGKKVKGKIVLTEMSWDPPRPEKARIAFEYGAKALIIMNWGSIDNPVIQKGAVKSVWGNPTPEGWNKIPRITVISITRSAGEYLKDLLKKYGKVKIWLYGESKNLWVDATQPMANMNVNKEEFIVVGGHIEAWGKTAICNSSGNAMMMEIARVLAQHKDKLNRNIVFGFWDGHEIAEAAGSAWFVDKYWSELDENCIAYVNIDNPGIIETEIPVVRCSLELRDFTLNLIREVWGREGVWKPTYMGGDESFMGIGVPYISFSTQYTEEKVRKLNYAILSPWLHSEADTIDKIDLKLYEKHLEFYLKLIFRFCNSIILPYNHKIVIEELLKNLKIYEEKVITKTNVSINDVIERTNLLYKIVHEFDEVKRVVEEEYEEHGLKSRLELKVNVINKVLIRLSHELSHVMMTEAGRYDYDPYGYYLTGKPIPILYTIINRIMDLDVKSDVMRLWETKILRERKKILDAVNNSIRILRLSLKIIQDELK